LPLVFSTWTSLLLTDGSQRSQSLPRPSVRVPNPRRPLEWTTTRCSSPPVKPRRPSQRLSQIALNLEGLVNKRISCYCSEIGRIRSNYQANQLIMDQSCREKQGKRRHKIGDYQWTAMNLGLIHMDQMQLNHGTAPSRTCSSNPQSSAHHAQ
jgi:hypothetical protein